MQVDQGREVGASHPPFIITTRDARELTKLADALAAIDVAANSRCDAVKLGLPHVPWAWCTSLFQRADERGVVLLARAEDEEAVERLDWLGAHAYDIPFQICDLELVARAARTGKAIVMAVGTASILELAEIAEIVKRNGTGGLALMVPIHDDEDLLKIDALQHLGVSIGVSDASPDPRRALAAIARGASVVEKRRVAPAVMTDVIRHCELAWSSLATNVGTTWATN
ncbi:MAG: N-acetylneuraminate synthase family protein [Deltaproteobacteria bacterium]|nr:N-acetylneuraminate synthase family protein [Deltaproteobacteria bacterium]